MSALLRQVGGEHYKKLVIQPIEYIHLNDIGFIEGSVIKYVTRWKNKGGYSDIRKAIHLLELLLELDCEDDVCVAGERGPVECGRTASLDYHDAGYESGLLKDVGNYAQHSECERCPGVSHGVSRGVLATSAIEGECGARVVSERGPAHGSRCDSVAMYDAGYRLVGSEWVKSWPGGHDV